MIYTEQQEWRTVTVEFIVGKPQRRYAQLGKSWPTTTQCLVKIDGLVVGLGMAVKHTNDVENPLHGRKIAAQKAFAVARYNLYKETRIRLWKQILGNTFEVSE